MEITIRVHQKFSSRVNRPRIKKIVTKALRAEKANASLAIYITGDDEMRAFNRDYHATDTPTDVLSFSNGKGAIESRPYIGDVIVSYDTARTQAREAGWRIADELDLLALHGTLHLLGYDDLTPRKRARMWKRQVEILGREIRGQ